MTALVAEPELLERSWSALGTTATVLVDDPDQAQATERIVAAELMAIDRACSRFRSDSELRMVQAHAGRPVRVSTLLFEALEVACSVAERTHGAVDPTVGNAIAALGYDRDLAEVQRRPRPSPPLPPPPALGRVAGYQHVQLNRRERTVRIPRGVQLDLGSSAKALAADRAAAHVAHELGTGVLVSIGGDVAVAGPPPAGGWAVGIAERSATPADEVDQVVAICHGGLASSSPSARAWVSGDRPVHHIIDPRSGNCAEAYWTLVSATGASCVDANAVTTAALVWGRDALAHLAGFDQAVRLVRHDGRVFVINGWPEEHPA